MVQHGAHGFDAVVYEIGLPPSFPFPEDGVLYNGVIVFRHIGLDGVSVGGRGGNGNHVPHPCKAHVQGAGNRGGRQGEHVDAGGPGFPFSFCTTPNRCSSSTTRRPSFRQVTFLFSTAWVPMITSTSPSFILRRISFFSFRVVKRFKRARFTPNCSMRSLKFL